MNIKRYFYLMFALLFFACVDLSCKSDAPGPNDPAKLFIYSVTASPTNNESITLKNNSGRTMDISGWTLGDTNSPDAYSIPANTLLAHGQYLTFSHTTLGFQIDDSGETLYLKHKSGSEVDTWRH